MPTLKKRINISIPSNLEGALEYLSKRDQVPQATKAADLHRIAIEIEEDQAWNQFASKRDTRGSKFVSHNKAWS